MVGLCVGGRSEGRPLEVGKGKERRLDELGFSVSREFDRLWGTQELI